MRSNRSYVRGEGAVSYNARGIGRGSRLWSVLLVVVLGVGSVAAERAGAQVSTEPSGIRRGGSGPGSAPVGEESRGRMVPLGAPNNRGRIAAVGAVVGAGVGAFGFIYACTHVTECMTISGAVPLMGMGAGVGAVAALLVTPVRRTVRQVVPEPAGRKGEGVCRLNPG